MEMDKPEPTWAELLGSKQWEGLLDPLNLSLRRLILRCGDLCQATYDAFNSDPRSKYCGSSRYGKRSFFEKVKFQPASDYEVAAFLYATSRVDVPQAFLLHSLSREAWDRESNWIGYIAVTSDHVSKKVLGRREIYVAWRGTTRNYEWIDVADAKPKSIKSLLNSQTQDHTQQQSHWYDLILDRVHDNGSGDSSDEEEEDRTPKVMKGWFTIYTSNDPKSPFTKLSARAQFVTKMKELVEQYKDEELSLTLTGHSLGACLAILSAFDVVENGLSIPVAAIVFGCPQVGNKAFDQRIKKFSNLRILHVKNAIDLIPHYPSRALGYHYTGTELVIDTRKSPSLKDSKNPSDWHNLQAMLHVVAGWNGADKEFELKVKRTIALVNKSCDYLKEELLVPPSWWVEKNKGMVLNQNEEWELTPPFEDDIPVPEF
ncbi:PREDICTED: phospholipase A1-IIdelta [Nelumbo nucifera]|uniref:Phospholipase A1 n=2 Tax=Nelumbo nucifera TaxID=4432 RepID=A0A1U8B7H7_NELNU|nr:PREDICTED: phospholipase A1-IIdelta [Nelumbo nucifera]DAD24891.1 TPA_asm: hypothetical protein HUJ06_026355 [Nelumbo nucifera]